MSVFSTEVQENTRLSIAEHKGDNILHEKVWAQSWIHYVDKVSQVHGSVSAFQYGLDFIGTRFGEKQK